MELFDLFQKGGPVMYALLLCSIATAVMMIERIFFYRRARSGLLAFEKELPALLASGWEKTALACDKEKNAGAFFIGQAAKAAAEGKDPELALDTAYGTAAAELRARLNYLSMIVTLSPLLGLLGTIAGMINSFNIFSLQAGQPLAITGGIGEALIATATGLCVAIFALVVHTYFAQKMDEILTVLDRMEAAFLSEFRKRGLHGA